MVFNMFHRKLLFWVIYVNNFGPDRILTYSCDETELLGCPGGSGFVAELEIVTLGNPYFDIFGNRQIGCPGILEIMEIDQYGCPGFLEILEIGQFACPGNLEILEITKF